MRKIRALTKFFYVITFSIITFLILFFLSSFFRVEVLETNAYPELLKGLPDLKNQSILWLPQEEIKKHFLKNFKVKEVKITKKLPKTIVVNLVYRERLVLVVAKNGLFFSDEEGFIFENSTNEIGYPLLNLQNKEINLGIIITQKNILKALRIVKLFNDEKIQIINITPLTEEEILLTLNQGTLVLIGSDLEPEQIVSSLQKIIKRFTIEGKTIKKIDFRFNNPIVSF